MKDAVTDMDPRSVFDPKDEPVVAVPKRELEAAKPEVAVTPVASEAAVAPEVQPPTR